MEQKSDNKKRKKKLIFLVFSLIVVTIGMVVAIALIISKPAEPEIDSRSFEEMFFANTTIEDAISEFQTKIDTTKSPEEKAELYIERANFLFINYATKKVFNDQILNDIEEAKNLNPSEEYDKLEESIKIYFYPEGTADE